MLMDNNWLAPARCHRITGLCLAVLVSLIISNCSQNATNGDDEEPPPAPAAVDDLHVVDVTPTTVTLAWTVPEPDEEHGYASAYDIRYVMTEPEDENVWETATQLDHEPGSWMAGTVQTWTVTGLQYGQTYYFAMKCCGEGDEPLWSGVSNLAEATLPIDYDVAVPDTVLESILRDLFDKPTGSLRYADMLTITELGLSNRGVADLSGLEHCENLRMLHATDNTISDVTPLSELRQLEMIDLINNQITDVASLAGLTNLQHLHIGQNDISDISSLSSLTELKIFRAHYNDITEIAAVEYMTDLEWLDLRGNNISDIAPLVNNAGFGSGDMIQLEGNPLSQTAIDTHIPALEARGVDVTYYHPASGRVEQSLDVSFSSLVAAYCIRPLSMAIACEGRMQYAPTHNRLVDVC
ncbi:MAG: hypothetical protein GF341_12680 [candidate division Zixibacteria bacterium]|nr:hypothetical protein [candidate division Zixibacteria bacterium]